jgi:hypothetical protein
MVECEVVSMVAIPGVMTMRDEEEEEVGGFVQRDTATDLAGSEVPLNLYR